MFWLCCNCEPDCFDCTPPIDAEPSECAVDLPSPVTGTPPASHVWPSLSPLQGLLHLYRTTNPYIEGCPCFYGYDDRVWKHYCNLTFVANEVPVFWPDGHASECYRTKLENGHPGCGVGQSQGTTDFGISYGISKNTNTNEWWYSMSVNGYNTFGGSSINDNPGILMRYIADFDCNDVTSGLPFTLTITSASATAASNAGLTFPTTVSATWVLP